jgi:hypothetical protein
MQIDKVEGLGISKIFKPYISKNLLRIGHNTDGGYVINQEIFNKSELLLTFGLGDEFSFEEDFHKKKNIEIIVYDHTVTKTFWIKNFIKSLFLFISTGKHFLRIFKFLKYLKFFQLSNVNHIKLRVVEHNNYFVKNSISLVEIMKKINIPEEKILLKIDIEGDEYRLLEDISKFNFLGIIIEFHHFDLLEEKIIKFLENSIKYKIIHIHGNNFHRNKNNNPTICEITFANSDLVYVDKNKINYELPINLDYPNIIGTDQIPIKFRKI